ncbi:MAG TPA: MFS transporter [Rhodocyclaceae bacterium]|nr:MFS transporter [Rhodocyclaceae bacterium]
MKAVSNTVPRKDRAHRAVTRGERRVIIASSMGTVFEWYDFYLYGSLASVISKQFFSGVNETTAFIFALLAFAAGFAVRPLGAILFGRLGDMIGRKYTFLVTILIMGLSTAVVGMLPTYSQIGVSAPIVLVTLRLMQGLALGGEYGGAATYVAEHAPPGKRGLFTSFIQSTATVGLLLSLTVILLCRQWLGKEFDEWGWRIPFLMSVLLLIVSIYIRMQLNESPVFLKMKDAGQASRAPLTEAFARWGNLKVVILVMLGGTAGQAVVWYTGHFYALFFLLQTLKLDPQTANLLMAGSLILGTPFYVFFGSLSDRIGRKPIIMIGCLLAAATYFPIFKALTEYANPAIFKAQQQNPVVVIADPAQCSLQFDPVGKRRYLSSCDIAKAWLAKKAIPYSMHPGPAGMPAQVWVGKDVVDSFDGSQVPVDQLKFRHAEFDRGMASAVRHAGYPTKADPSQINIPVVLGLLTLLVIYVTMVYGPIAAWLVELFPARIRYTSLSLPYHIGNGWFGGFLPTVAFAMVAATGDIYYGLWYPVVVSLITVAVGAFFLPETKDREIHHV